jgi:hypothetical protein
LQVQAALQRQRQTVGAVDDLVIGFAVEDELMQAGFQLAVAVFQFQHLPVGQRNHHPVLWAGLRRPKRSAWCCRKSG